MSPPGRGQVRGSLLLSIFHWPFYIGRFTLLLSRSAKEAPLTLSSPPPKEPRSRRKLLLLILSAALLLLLILLLALALWPPDALSHPLPDDQLLSDALSFEQQLETVLNARISKLPVQLSVSAEEVNGYCAALQRDELWTRLRIQDDSTRTRWRPSAFSDVRITFHANQAWLIGSLSNTRLPLVLSICLRPQLEPDHSLSLVVTSVRVGHLPLPVFLVRHWLGPLAHVSLPQHDSWSVKHIGIIGGRLYLLAGPSEQE